MSARSRSRPARTCGRWSTSTTRTTSRCRSPCASACRRPARCSPARASTTPSCRWAATRSASPARCRARRSAWSRRAPSTPWRSPTAELVLEGYVNPRDRRFETKESEDAGVQGRYHFHPEWAGYMGKAYKAPTFHVTAVTMRKPAGQADHLCARRAHARRSQHRHHGARGGDLRAVQPAAARHRAGRGDPLLHDRLGRLHHPGQEAPPARRGLAAQLPGRARWPARRACGSPSR